MKRIFLYIFLCGLMTPKYSVASIPDKNDPAVAYLVKGIVDLDKSISEKKQELYSLKMNWYDICVRYLQKDPNSFKKEDLDALIRQTVEDIDGEELMTELKKAFNEMGKYHYVPVPKPSIMPKLKANKKSKKTPSSNSNPKKINKDPNSQTPKDGKIEEDPTKEKPGNDKVVDNNESEVEAPPVSVPPVTTSPEDNLDGKEPTEVTPREKDDVGGKTGAKQPKKGDKGSIEGGKSKGTKPKDGGLK